MREREALHSGPTTLRRVLGEVRGQFRFWPLGASRFSPFGDGTCLEWLVWGGAIAEKTPLGAARNSAASRLPFPSWSVHLEEEGTKSETGQQEGGRLPLPAVRPWSGSGAIRTDRAFGSRCYSTE
jgi:hypothetical protein